MLNNRNSLLTISIDICHSVLVHAYITTYRQQANAQMSEIAPLHLF